MKFLAFCIALLFASTWIHAQDLQDPEITGALSLLNDARRDAGLEPVSISPELSKGCYLHAKYLAMNMGSEQTSGLGAHTESAELPGHTAAGERAGQSSVIHYVKPLEAIDGWLATLYHRIPLLQPQLAEIGIGYYEDDGNVVSLIDCITGTTGSSEISVVYYPAMGQSAVPCAMGPEIPHPVGERGEYGFPITIYFAQYQSVKNVAFKLTDPTHKAVACYVSTPDQPATDFPQWNSICAIAHEPLKPNTTYTVTLSCLLDDAPFKQTYSFTTGQE